MNERQKALRLATLERIRSRGFGHSGRALSSIDLMEALYFGKEQGRPLFLSDPKRPQLEERDLFVLSKLEALPALYSVLDMKGFALPEDLSDTPDRRTPGIDLSSKRHAYGISYAVGLAAGIQMERKNQHVFCLAGDYELRYGETWEAIMEAADQKLERLCLIIDENDPKDLRLQERFDSFGWKVIKLPNAHDHDDIVFAYLRARVTQRKPTCIWAPTIKSSGVPFAERKPEYDDVVFSDAEMLEARKYLLS